MAVWLSLRSGQYMYCNNFLSVYEDINFEVNLRFLTKNFFLKWLKTSEQYFKYFPNGKSILGEIKKQFSSFLKNGQKFSRTWECVFESFLHFAWCVFEFNLLQSLYLKQAVLIEISQEMGGQFCWALGVPQGLNFQISALKFQSLRFKGSPPSEWASPNGDFKFFHNFFFCGESRRTTFVKVCLLSAS